LISANLKLQKRLYKLSDESGTLQFTLIAEGDNISKRCERKRERWERWEKWEIREIREMRKMRKMRDERWERWKMSGRIFFQKKKI
jgi:hypothetical protein